VFDAFQTSGFAVAGWWLNRKNQRRKHREGTAKEQLRLTNSVGTPQADGSCKQYILMEELQIHSIDIFLLECNITSYVTI
jgi:hypothetical protein